jgi:hypothetical protein
VPLHSDLLVAQERVEAATRAKNSLLRPTKALGTFEVNSSEAVNPERSVVSANDGVLTEPTDRQSGSAATRH